MAEKQVRTVEKIFAQESKADEDKVKRAMKDMEKLEKACQKSVKETEKAQKALEKAGKGKLKTSKILTKAEEKFQDAVHGREKAEKLAIEMSQREDLEEQDLQQRRNQISEAFGEYNAHEHSRIHQRSEIINGAVDEA